jgi:replicative DNA helicase
MVQAGTGEGSGRMIEGRVCPHCLDTERAVLASAIIDRRAFDSAVGMLTRESFYGAAHAEVFACLAHMSAAGIPVDIVSVAGELRKRGRLESVGGEGFLSELVEEVATSANVRYHCRVLQGKAALRATIRACRDTIEACYSADAEPEAVIAQAQNAALALSVGRRLDASQSARDILPGVLRDVERYHKGEMSGLKTGFPTLDLLTTGLHSGDLVLLAARPSVGKTAFALAVALHCARGGGPVHMFSLEMTKEQLIMRLLCSIAGASMHLLRTGRMGGEEYGRVLRYSGEVDRLSLFIEDTPGLRPQDMLARARRLRQGGGLGLVIVDHLQLVRTPERAENRTQELTKISGGLKRMAKELGTPVLALSQLSREIEKRRDAEPRLSDLRESGALEQDADVVMFLWRPDECDDEADEEEIRLSVAKQRNGPLGRVAFVFDKRGMRFRESGCEGSS